ncbi:MAG: hypothetical protein LC793_11810 [Thermomicrobia bacterium]|nr:hypothetical protein [Thermomicrobia bacterium]
MLAQARDDAIQPHVFLEFNLDPEMVIRPEKDEALEVRPLFPHQRLPVARERFGIDMGEIQSARFFRHRAIGPFSPRRCIDNAEQHKFFAVVAHDMTVIGADEFKNMGHALVQLPCELCRVARCPEFGRSHRLP